MSKAELTKLVESGEITLTDVIDVVVELNGFIGVGLISLGEGLDKYVKDKIGK